ncbi:MAG: Gfo/Idh/MocA family oxidoreductase [Tannerellaceae bacterium]|jgi:predicted dehydrogenase|nr:Gfo/Idh/MocA family oxidoreductase [Tannerellaceae bacterium]
MINRRTFLKNGTVAGLGLLLPYRASTPEANLRVGIIGLDTSHSTAFTRLLNSDTSIYGGYKVLAAYPQGSKDIESSTRRIPAYTEEAKKLGVEIVSSIDELLEKTDVILLETNDGRLHLEQALEIFKAGKKVFIDKPVAASLTDAIAIYRAAEKYNVPVFSASSLRYMSRIDDILQKQIAGRVLGADTFSPCTLEATHPDLFWYGIHGIEALYTVMGIGCKSVSRVHTPDTDVVTGIWEDNRIGRFRGLRAGKTGYGGYVFGEKSIQLLGDYNGYAPLLKDIIRFFQTGIPPVRPQETLEIFTFMEAAHESTRRDGASVALSEVWEKANAQMLSSHLPE